MAIGRPKGETNRYWSKEDKLKLVKEVIDEHKSTSEVSSREIFQMECLIDGLKIILNMEKKD